MKLALQNLLQDKLRFALSVTGIALAVMLILFLLGLRAGVFRSAAIYLDNAPGSVAVMPEGVKSTSAGSARFVLVTPEPGTNAAQLVASLQSVPGTNVLLKSQVIANDKQIVAGI